MKDLWRSFMEWEASAIVIFLILLTVLYGILLFQGVTNPAVVYGYWVFVTVFGALVFVMHFEQIRERKRAL